MRVTREQNRDLNIVE